MYRYIFKRMALAILTLFIVLIFSYILIVSFISNPYEKMLADNYSSLNPSQRAALKEAIKDFESQSVFYKLFLYFKRFFHGNFGEIYLDASYLIPKNVKLTVPNLFFYPLRWTLAVSIPAFVISALTGIVLGIYAGYKRGKLTDSIINFFVTFFISVPSFIIAPFFINMFTKIGFPSSFIAPDNAAYANAGIWTTIKSLIPAIIVVTLGSLAVYTLYSRNQVVSVLTSNYVLIAKTKGLSGFQIFRKYVFRNIAIPLAAIIIPSYIVLLSGSIIIEQFWGINGSSSVIIQAFPNGEINVVMFNVFFFTALGIGTEVFVDISYALIDPRIKYSHNSSGNYYEYFKAYITRRREEKEIIKGGLDAKRRIQ